MEMETAQNFSIDTNGGWSHCSYGPFLDGGGVGNCIRLKHSFGKRRLSKGYYNIILLIRGHGDRGTIFVVVTKDPLPEIGDH